jgi:hypothetical protein
MQKLPKSVIFFLFLFFFLINPPKSLAGCTSVASNQTDCGNSEPIACMQPTPVAGNIKRWCCDTEDSCNNAKSGEQQQIANQLASDSDAFPELRYPCDKPGLTPEFHSLRPYQAAFCGDANKALYCSNDLKFVETFDDFPQCVDEAPDEDGAVSLSRYTI